MSEARFWERSREASRRLLASYGLDPKGYLLRGRSPQQEDPDWVPENADREPHAESGSTRTAPAGTVSQPEDRAAGEPLADSRPAATAAQPASGVFDFAPAVERVIEAS